MWIRTLTVLLVLAVAASIAAASSANVAPGSYRKGMEHYFKYHTFTPEFQALLKNTNISYVFRSDALPTSIFDDMFCVLCEELLTEALTVIRDGSATIEEMHESFVGLCKALAYDDDEVCNGIIGFNIGIVWHIALARPDKQAANICGIVGQGFGCPGTPADWSIDVPEGEPVIDKGIVSDETPLKVLHLTDIHYDPYYAPESEAVCGLPVCCTINTVPDIEENAAGFWGDYRDCDSPLHAIDEALDRIAHDHEDIDYIYYTGDIIHHRVWSTSIEENTEDMKLIFDKLTEAFPNTPIYPALGNHESHPLNVFAPLEITTPGLSTQWLFDLSADIWSRWLDEEALDTVRNGGFYTVLAKPGFRIIVLNSNVAYTMNWWLIYDDYDPYGQLNWLAETLLAAEQNEEKVHILSHLPSSDSTTYSAWSREYRRIAERFAGTITATFNGHSHRDELILYHHSERPTEPIGVAWNGGSLTTFSDKNPNYKLFEVDAESYEVLDYDVWTYNITAANLAPDTRPNWFKLYSFKDAYGLSGAAPSDVRELAEKMASDRSVVEQYFRFSVRYADTSLEMGCNDDCLKTQLCDLLKSQYGDRTQCDELAAEW